MHFDFNNAKLAQHFAKGEKNANRKRYCRSIAAYIRRYFARSTPAEQTRYFPGSSIEIPREIQKARKDRQKLSKEKPQEIGLYGYMYPLW